MGRNRDQKQSNSFAISEILHPSPLEQLMFRSALVRENKDAQ